MDWLLTMPLLRIEILLVMNSDENTYGCTSEILGTGSTLAIVNDDEGELTVTSELSNCWQCKRISMAFFLYIAYELLIYLSVATTGDDDQ